MARLPPVVRPSVTELTAEDARERLSPVERWEDIRIFPYLDLLSDRCDAPLYVGVSGRPAILLRLSDQLRANLDGIGELIQRRGANLFLSGHRVGRCGMVRAVLELPEYDLIFETPLTLAYGDVQEFISATYANEAIELHLAHTNVAQTLGFACHASGVRPVVDAVLKAVRNLDHPATEAEQAAPVAELEARFPKISDGLSTRTRIQLTVTGPADPTVRVTTHN